MRYLTAGESHGQALVGIMDGCPSGLKITAEEINADLKRRQQGYGRGGRMKIESDTVEIVSGVRNCLSLGSPIALLIKNKDYANWVKYMSPDECDTESKKVTLVRPAHADLAGVIKYNHKDARNILERASARETAMRVALGGVAKIFLKSLGIKIVSYVTEIGGVKASKRPDTINDLKDIDQNPVRCYDEEAAGKIIKLIDEAKESGDTLGGKIEIIVSGMKAGFGSHTQYDKKLDYKIMGDLGSMQAVKSVSIGLGEDYARQKGSLVHDEIGYQNGKFFRRTNNSGGIDGGISNGEDIIIMAAIKPIPTLMKGLKTVDILTYEEGISAKERSDVCAVPAAGVVAEAITALSLMQVILDTLGGDYMEEVIQRWTAKKQTI